MRETLKAVGETFRLNGTFDSYDTITQGNINGTYKVTYREADGTEKSYLFQRVNTNVFKNPREIMENIDKVTSYIRANNPDQLSLHFHHTAEGLNYDIMDEGSFWRVSNFVDSETYDITEDLEVIRATGEAFGHFQMQLAGFNGAELHETIPDFHNTKKRLDTLFADAERDVCGRAAEVQDELDYIRSVRDYASEISVKFAQGEYPNRVTHNDTKANNVLFDRVTKRPLVVVDLDTVMPGVSMYDFADAVRFIASTAKEDEKDLSTVYFDTAKFRAFAEGFITEVKDVFTEGELNALVQASFSITVELAARFLDDYLNGDTYFKCLYPGHNLVRTRCQLKLAKDILRKQDELNWIVREVLGR